MKRTEFSPSIISRPVYAELQSHGATPAIMLAEGPGAEALIDLAGRDASVMDKAHVIYVPAGCDHGPTLQELQPKFFHQAPSLAAAQERLTKALSDAQMGTQLYLAGTEGLIGRASALATSLGFPAGAIQAEHRGSIARPMQCVHCKGITENVITDPFTCSHCGLTLFVRDHFSRRLGVFQGVCVDAETPGVVPATEEIQP
ncbi:dimethylamine monooxygenase subunit DmmA family protein [Thalassovita sp.]|jgi:predicted RNA-binding Zn-ribbon protein involved in translation (DUF1610 family)|uniref:dimethylamine monooxygenase subunit DmmA family protein n=1 Tax=Thalassovita sp. TaxID=1979401 RepID=UPI003B595919